MKSEGRTLLRYGWLADALHVNGVVCDLVTFNPDGKGGRKFFEITTVGQPHGEPIMVQEPTLGIPLDVLDQCRFDIPEGVDARICSVIAYDAYGNDILRRSWSNLRYIDEMVYELKSDGELIVDGQSYGFLGVVHDIDKNRNKGLVGFCYPERREEVRYIELVDVGRHYVDELYIVPADPELR